MFFILSLKLKLLFQIVGYHAVQKARPRNVFTPHFRTYPRRLGYLLEKMSPARFIPRPHQGIIKPFSLWLKITKKVSYNIASEANYVYIMSGQKLIKNSKNGQYWKIFEAVLPDRSILIGQKLVEKSHKSKIQMRHFD